MVAGEKKKEQRSAQGIVLYINNHIVLCSAHKSSWRGGRKRGE